MNPLSNADRLAAIAAEIAAGGRKDTALPARPGLSAMTKS